MKVIFLFLIMVFTAVSYGQTKAKAPVKKPQAVKQNANKGKTKLPPPPPPILEAIKHTPPTLPEKKFGALAIDRTNGFYYGWANDYPNVTDAEQKALEECNKRGGNCTIVLTFLGAGCAVYRTIDGKVGTAYGWGIGKTKEEADAIAMREYLARSKGQAASNFVWSCNSENAYVLKEIYNASGEIPTSVKIGDQEWMDKNLNVTTFRNGDTITRVFDWKEWIAFYEAGKPAYIQFDDHSYAGKLYNQHAINDPRGLAPEGWHIPSRDEWLRLVQNAGDPQNLKSSSLWDLRNGSNKLGFNALPLELYFSRRPRTGGETSWWTSTKNAAYNVTMNLSEYSSGDELVPGNQDNTGSYVRCLKD